MVLETFNVTDAFRFLDLLVVNRIYVFLPIPVRTNFLEYKSSFDLLL